MFALFLLLSCSRKHTHTGKIACVKSQNVIFFFFILLFRRHKAFIFSVYLLLFSSIQLFSLHLIYFYHFAIWWKKKSKQDFAIDSLVLQKFSFYQMVLFISFIWVHTLFILFISIVFLFYFYFRLNFSFSFSCVFFFSFFIFRVYVRNNWEWCVQ